MNPLKINTDIDIRLLITILTLIAAAAGATAVASYQNKQMAAIVERLQEDVKANTAEIVALQVLEAKRQGREEADREAGRE